MAVRYRCSDSNRQSVATVYPIRVEIQPYDITVVAGVADVDSEGGVDIAGEAAFRFFFSQKR